MAATRQVHPASGDGKGQNRIRCRQQGWSTRVRPSATSKHNDTANLETSAVQTGRVEPLEPKQMLKLGLFVCVRACGHAQGQMGKLD